MTRLSKVLVVFGALFLGVVLLLAITPVRTFLVLLFMKRNVPFDKPLLEAVVARVRFLNLGPGERRPLRLDNVHDANSLRIMSPTESVGRGHGAGNVWASRESGGALTVLIETLDLGHAGASGYAYSEHPSPEVEAHLRLLAQWSNLGCTETSSKVAERWWEVTTCDMD